jgi:ATP-dependent Lon protease
MPLTLPNIDPAQINGADDYKLPEQLPLIPVKDLVIFPSMVVSVYIKNGALVETAQKAIANKELIGLFSQVNPLKPVPPMENLYPVGTAAAVLQVIKGTGSDAMILVEGISRIRLKATVQTEPYIVARVELIAKEEKPDLETEALMREVKELIVQVSRGGKTLPEELLTSLDNLTNAEELADLASSYLTLDVKSKQELLATEKLFDRLKKVAEYLNKEVMLQEIRKKIHTDMNKDVEKTERDYLLRQELKAIKKELGDKESPSIPGMEGMDTQDDIKELEKRITDAKMPPEAEKIAKGELERLKKIFPFSPEFSVARTYIEWLCDVPWNKSIDSKVDVKKARKILDEDHYGLQKIKERILEYLSVYQLKGSPGATILCFVGPPGVGKTSLGRSIARALGRSFIHTSLGGIRDEADIRGHRRTYVGAMPGRIIQSLKRAGFNDPVFMLDEIDKIGRDFQGDPSAALLEALDPEQNFAFTDHYLDVPFNLSKVLFVTTANVLDPIPPALLDRMEIIELAGYTEEEKLVIAHKYLLPKQLNLNGLEKFPFTMSDEAIVKVIRAYTFEAGLRELERELATICRKVAKKMIETKVKTKEVGVKDIAKFLGVEKVDYEKAEEKDMVGVATGLAWTPVGGDIIFIEAALMSGSKNLILTGNLGEVMEESARTGLSYIRSNSAHFGIPDKIFDKHDIHIHVPEGATPKDGPSAGITMCTALVSLLTNQKVRRDVAMTGEITLTGRILPIGGLKEKILAAKRALINNIIIPDRNKKDLADIPQHLLKDMNIRFAKTLDDVLKIALIHEKRPAAPQNDAAQKPQRAEAKVIPAADGKKKPRVKIVKMEEL